MTRRCALAALPLGLAALSFAPSARATDVPKYGDLPVGRVTAMPATKAPSFIAARERAPGFFVAMTKFRSETPARARHVSIVGDQKAADAIREDKPRSADELATCFSESSISSSDDDGPAVGEWSGGVMREIHLWPKSKDNASAGIAAVHSERIVDTNGKISLESVDAWVDPVTQGARVIARAVLPLVQVGRAIGGVKVYAGRDERRGGPPFVQFLVVRPRGLAARPGEMEGTDQDGNSASGDRCGHLRMALAVDAKHGDSAVVIAPIELPSAEAAPKPEAKREPVERESRTRDIQIHLSVSQTTRDREPLLAVSFGWASREAVQRVREEAPHPRD